MLCDNSILHMNEAVLHLEVRNQNGVQSESQRSEYVALQKQAADFYRHNSHYFTGTGFKDTSYTKLRLSSS